MDLRAGEGHFRGGCVCWMLVGGASSCPSALQLYPIELHTAAIRPPFVYILLFAFVSVCVWSPPLHFVIGFNGTISVTKESFEWDIVACYGFVMHVCDGVVLICLFVSVVVMVTILSPALLEILGRMMDGVFTTKYKIPCKNKY